jgi:predicted HicB family RNase H-like nuclease
MRKTGRPQLTPERRKASTFSVRFTAEEREAVEAAAERAGVKASEWARRVLLDAALRDA